MDPGYGRTDLECFQQLSGLRTRFFARLSACIFSAILLSGLFMMHACTTDEDFRVFVILKGDHFSSGRGLVFSNTMYFRVYIDSSWVYEGENHWNKLIGLSDAIDHHRNSNRLAWRCENGKIRFAHYCYQDGQRVIVPFTRSYEPGIWVEGYLRNKGAYLVGLGNEKSSLKRTGKMVSHALFPYFGGQQTAPHDMQFVFDFEKSLPVD
jgi:hypothetical protein